MTNHIMTFKKNFNFFNVLSSIIAVAAVFNMSPYIMWQESFIFKNLWGIFLGLSDILFISFLFKEKNYINYKFWFLSIPILSFLIKLSITPGYNGVFYTKYSALLAIVSLLSFSDKKILLDVYEKYKMLLVAIFVISGTMFILLLLGIIDTSSFHTTQHINELKDSYISCFFLTIEKSYISLIKEGFIYTRFSSIFDEPGVVGTVCALILAGEKFCFKDKKNYIFLLAGIASVSLFFLVTVIPLLIVKYRKSLIQFKNILLNMLIVFFCYLLISYFAPEFLVKIYDLTLGRFLSPLGAGGNAFSREPDIIKVFFSQFSEKDLWIQFWGMGHNAVETLCPGSSIYKVSIINYGYLGFGLILLHIIIPYLYVLCQSLKNNFLNPSIFYSFSVLTIINLLNIFQRPNIWSLYHVLLYFGPFYKMYFDHLKEDYYKKQS